MERQHTLDYIRTVTKSICSAVRQDLGKAIENPRNFLAEFRKRLNEHFASLPGFVGMFKKEDEEAMLEAEGYAYDWYGMEIQDLVEIRTDYLEEQIGFHVYEADPDDGNYLDLQKMTEQIDFYITLSKPLDQTDKGLFRLMMNTENAMVPNEVMVKLVAHHKSRSSENYKQRVIFQDLRIDIKEEWNFLITLIHKFICRKED